jgi:hypothetical protein
MVKQSFYFLVKHVSLKNKTTVSLCPMFNSSPLPPTQLMFNFEWLNILILLVHICLKLAISLGNLYSKPDPTTLYVCVNVWAMKTLFAEHMNCFSSFCKNHVNCQKCVDNMLKTTSFPINEAILHTEHYISNMATCIYIKKRHRQPGVAAT